MNRLLGTMLVEQQLISHEQLQDALDQQRRTGERLASICLELALLDESQLAQVLSRQAGIPFLVMSQTPIQPDALELLPFDLARLFLALPIYTRGNELIVAMANPADTALVGELNLATGRRVVEHGALFGPLKKRIEQAYHPDSSVLSPSTSVPATGITVVKADFLPLELDGPPPGTDPAMELLQLRQAHLEPVENRPERLMVVEDDETLRQMLTRFLTKQNYEVIEAADGRSALQQLQHGLPDAVLLDVMLPGVHGFEVCRILKQAKATRHIPVIMMSAAFKGQHNTDRIRLLHGAESYLEKPLKLTHLRQVIQNCLLVRNPAPSHEQLSQMVTDLLHRASEAERLDDKPAASAFLEQALEVAPFFPSLHHRLALLALQLDETYQAIEHLQRAVELRLEPDWLYKLAQTYERAGFIKKACTIWEQAASLIQDPAVQQRIRRHLRQMTD